MQITIEQTAERLKENNDFLLLTHMSPDGDTLGSAHALCRILQALGKNARVLTEGKIPKKFEYLSCAVAEQSFDEKYIVAIDIADEGLFPASAAQYKGRVDLCIDHHISNTHYSSEYCVENDAAACAEIVFKVIKALKADIDRTVANCLFTGLTTDTGCFRYSNVTKQTMNTAAQLIEIGCDSYMINKRMFEMNSKQRVAVEQMALESLRYYDGDKIAVMCVTLDMIKKSGVDEGELEGLAAIPRTIEGVAVGITVRQKKENVYKVSVRSDESVCCANKLCAIFGGGGHAAAGGCIFKDEPLELVIERLVKAAQDVLEPQER